MYGEAEAIFDARQHRIHELACGILSETGMRFGLPEAVGIFKRHGFKTDGETVFIKQAQAENTLKAVPGEFDVIAPAGNTAIHVGGGSRVYTSSGSSVRIRDFDGSVRLATGDDYVKALKLIQGIDVISACFEYVVPHDVPQDYYLLFNLCAQMLTVGKPFSCQHADAVPMLSIYYGTTADKMRESAKNGLAYGISYINPASPLAMSGYEANKLISFCRAGIAAAVSPMALCGMTAPCTLEGLIVQQTAEILGGIVLSQLVSEGAPVLYGCLGAITNMRNMFAPIGAPESRIIEHASARMARFYNIPSRSLVCMTDANEIDYQCGAESMLNLAAAAQSGINVQTGIGSCSNLMTASFEKLILDAESAAYIQRLFRPLDFSDERAAADLIKNIGPRGSYIMEEHTLAHYRDEFLETNIFERQTYDIYISEGRLTLKDRALKRIEELTAGYKRPYVEHIIKKQLREYCEAYGLGESIRNRFED